MLRHIPLAEDLALKRLVTIPLDQKPGFAWRDALGDPSLEAALPKVVVTRGKGDERQFNLADVADEIGAALTDLLLSRQEKDIFNEENRAFVANVAHSVATRLLEHVREGHGLKLSDYDLSLLIEKALIENDAHDVAKSLVFKRSVREVANLANEIAGERPTLAPVAVRLIRRNGTVVPWNESKIEIACRKAFLTTKEDPESAHQDRSCGQRSAFAAARARSFISRTSRIWFKRSSCGRDSTRLPKATFSIGLNALACARRRRNLCPRPEQESLVVVRGKNGQSVFWDGSELKRRIQFATIGLDLCFDERRVERELRRSIGAEISEEGLRSTIILNAKLLIEKDADFASSPHAFSSPTSTRRSSIGASCATALKVSEKPTAKPSKPTCVTESPLNDSAPKLLQYDIEKLAETLDPSADLDFQDPRHSDPLRSVSDCG